MFEVVEFTVEQLEDPFALLSGERFEFKLYLSVDEEDDLYTDKGVYLRIIFTVDTDVYKISQYSFHEQSSDRYLEFELEDDEEKMVYNFCKENLPLQSNPLD